MRILENKEKYLKYYLDSICFMDKLQVSAIKRMAQSKEQGAEYISCSFDPNNEDYKEGYVTLLFWKPADEEDTMVFIKNEMFYEHLLKMCESYIFKEPQIKDELQCYLERIKEILKI